MSERPNDTGTDRQGKGVGEGAVNKPTSRPTERQQDDTNSKVRKTLD